MKKVFTRSRQQVGNNMPLFYTEYNDGLYDQSVTPSHDSSIAAAFAIKTVNGKCHLDDTRVIFLLTLCFQTWMTLLTSTRGGPSLTSSKRVRTRNHSHMLILMIYRWSILYSLPRWFRPDDYSRYSQACLEVSSHDPVWLSINYSIVKSLWIVAPHWLQQVRHLRFAQQHDCWYHGYIEPHSLHGDHLQLQRASTRLQHQVRARLRYIDRS